MTDGEFRIFVQQGPNQGQLYHLTKEVVTIGRDISNDLVFNDPEVSRHHARLTRQGYGYALEDLGSTNGTFINGARLNVPRILTQGDIIALGETIRLGFESGQDGGQPESFGVQTIAEAPIRTPPTMQSAPPPQQSYAPPPQQYAPPPQQPPQQYTPPPPQQPPPARQRPAPPPPQAPPVVESASDSSGNRTRFIAIGLGCGTLFLCLLVLGAVAAFAPCEFWLPLYNILGIPAAC